MSNQSPEDEISKDGSPELNPSVNAQNMEAEQIEDGPREESLGNPEEVMDEKEPDLLTSSGEANLKTESSEQRNLDGLLLSTLVTDVVLIDEAKQLPTGFFATAHLG